MTHSISTPAMTQVQMLVRDHWKGHLRSYDVTTSFFSNNSRQGGAIDELMVSNDLTTRVESKDVHHDLIRSCWDLTLTSGQLLKLIFQCHKVHASNRLDEANTVVPTSLRYLS